MDERPPGWYRDPDDARAHRYWNGQTWTAAQAAQIEQVDLDVVVEVLEQR